MKHMKQHISLLIVLAMILVPFFPAMAAEGEGVISATNGEKGHTYTIYQIFTGTPVDNGSALTDLEWGSKINAANFVADLKANDQIKEFFPDDLDATNATAVAEAISKAYVDNQMVNAAIIAELACKNMTSGAGTQLSPDGTQSGSFPFGFYAVADANGTSGKVIYGVLSVLTEGTFDISAKTLGPKEEEPTLEKKVKASDTGLWQDAADYSIGDTVDFRLTAMLPLIYDEFDSYRLVFHDKQDAGLTFVPGSIKVAVGTAGTPLDSNQYTIVQNPTDDCTFEVIISDAKKITELGSGDPITLTYSATLNENAEIGANGNLNTAKLSYSENGSPIEKETPEDIVTVFTFQLEVDKVDPDRNPLVGAAFTLKDLEGNVIGTYEVDETRTTFTFEGLKQGMYVLEETAHPEGYNPIDPIYIKITADYEKTSPMGKVPSLRNLSAVQTDKDGNPIGDATATAKFTATLADGKLKTEIINRTGVVLPSTGGVGTTIFYAVGGLLIAGAVVLLITKRRMGADEK